MYCYLVTSSPHEKFPQDPNITPYIIPQTFPKYFPSEKLKPGKFSAKMPWAACSSKAETVHLQQFPLHIPLNVSHRTSPHEKFLHQTRTLHCTKILQTFPEGLFVLVNERQCILTSRCCFMSLSCWVRCSSSRLASLRSSSNCLQRTIIPHIAVPLWVTHLSSGQAQCNTTSLSLLKCTAMTKVSFTLSHASVTYDQSINQSTRDLYGAAIRLVQERQQ